MVRPSLFAVVIGAVLLLHAIPGCAIGGPDEQLNPQPLPPSDPPEKSVGDQNDPGSASGGGAAPNAPADAGAGDGGDGGENNGGDH
jgi:hypothetical protein